MLAPLKQLLSSIVDYAGLFPPAQLNLGEAIAIYDRARHSPHHWMLDRFVLTAPQLSELIKLLSKFPQNADSSKSWSLSVILSQNWAVELEQVQLLARLVAKDDYQILISAVEVAPLAPIEIQQMCLHLPAEITAFFEIPFNVKLEPYLQVLQQTGTAAKLRTGGMTHDAFPTSEQLGQRIVALAQAQIPFKATAGLHHALRNHYRLTNRPTSAVMAMHGFLNVAFLAAVAHQQAITLDEAILILAEPSIAQFQCTETTIKWREHVLSLPEITRSRRQFFRSFGSCSFQEPLDGLNDLGFL